MPILKIPANKSDKIAEVHATMSTKQPNLIIQAEEPDKIKRKSSTSGIKFDKLKRIAQK